MKGLEETYLFLPDFQWDLYDQLLGPLFEPAAHRQGTGSGGVVEDELMIRLSAAPRKLDKIEGPIGGFSSEPLLESPRSENLAGLGHPDPITGKKAPLMAVRPRESPVDTISRDLENNIVPAQASLAPGNAAPFLSTTPIDEAYIFFNYSYEASASDADGDVLTYELLSAPPSVEVDSTTGEVTWKIPRFEDIGNYPLVLQASDGKGGVAIQGYILEVTTPPPGLGPSNNIWFPVPSEPNEVPLFTTSPVEEAILGQSYIYSASATDADGDVLTYELLVAPSGASIDDTEGMITWNPTSNDLGTQAIVLQVDDGKGGIDVQAYILEVGVRDKQANAAPEFTTTPVDEAAVGIDYIYEAQAIDSDGDALTYELLSPPDGIDINSDTGMLTWNPTASDIGTHSLVLQVSDGKGGIDRQNYTLEVSTPPPNRPPLFTDPPVVDARVNTAYSYIPTVVDPDGDFLTISLVSGPEGMAIDPDTFEVTWTPTSDQLGIDDVTLRVTDGRGGIAGQQFSVLTQMEAGNAPPTIVSSPETMVYLGADYVYQVEAVDPDADELTYELVSGPEGLTIDPITGEIRGAFDARGGGTSERRIFFGEDLAPEHSDSVRIETPNSLQARDEFLGALTGWETEDFESYYTGTEEGSYDTRVRIDTLSFGEQKATLSESQGAIYYASEETTLNGAIPLSGTNLIVDFLTPYAIDFETPQAAFGAFITDFNDGGARLVLRLTHEDGSIEDVEVPHTSTNVKSGSALYLGLIDPDNPFTRVKLHHYGGYYDGFGYDDITIATPEQIRPESIPVTVQVQDGRGGVDSQTFNLELLTGGEIKGRVWFDENSNSIRDGAETGLSTVGVYLDLNENGELDAGEPTTETNEQGVYKFTDLEPGTYVVREVLPEGFEYTSPEPSLILGEENLLANPSFEESEHLTSPSGYVPHWESLGGLVDHWPWWENSDGDWSVDLNQFTPGGLAQTITTIPGRDYLVTFDLTANYEAPRDTPIPMRVQAAGQVGEFNGFSTGNRYDMDWQPQTWQFTAISDRTKIEFISQYPTPYGPAIDNTSVVEIIDSNDFKHVVTVESGEIATERNFGNSRIEPLIINTPPSFTSTPPETVEFGEIWRYEASATDPDNDALTYEVLNAPSGLVVNPQTGLFVWEPTLHDSTDVNPAPGAIPTPGLHDIVLSVRDPRGSVDLQYFQLQVLLSEEPVFTFSPPTSAAIARPFELKVSAIDNQGDLVSFDLENSPPGMTIDGSTGIISWTPTELGEFNITVTASDGTRVRSKEFDIIVVEAGPNSPPEITSTPRSRVRLGSNYVYQLEVLDPENNPLTITLSRAPDGMEIDENGLLVWRPTSAQFGSNEVEIVVADSQGGVTRQEFAISVTSQDPNSPPSITSTPSFGAVAGREYEYNLTGTDPDGDLLLWELTKAPAGMTLDALSGFLHWTPEVSQVGNNPIDIRLLDSRGAFTGQAFEIDVRGVNTPPIITSPPITAAAVDKAYEYQVIARDAENDVLTYSLTGVVPEGMTINSVTGLISWTPKNSHVGLEKVSVLVSDSLGEIASQDYGIIVESVAANLPPAITSVPIYGAAAGEVYSYMLEATDPEGESLIYQLLSGPPGMSVSETGLLSWEPTASDVGLYDIHLGVVDPKGLGGAQQFALTVRSNNAPNIVSAPAKTATPGLLYSYPVLAVDADNDRLSYRLVNGPTDARIDAAGIISWTPEAGSPGDYEFSVRVTDTFGAASTQNFTVSLQGDDTPPEVTLFQSLNFVYVGQSLTMWTSATDDVGVETLDLRVDDEPVALSPDGVASVSFDNPGFSDATATATDAAGNSASATATIEVLGESDGSLPVRELDPLPDDLVTNVIDLTGTISDDNLAEYKFEVAPIGSDDFVTIFTGTENVTDGVLGSFDPTLLLNDSYTLRVTARDTGGLISTISETVSVGGDLKLGNFQLSFTDLEVPVSGIPISVTRTYDSLAVGTQDDFGPGWRLEFRDTDLRTSLGPDETYETFGIRENAFTDNTRVYVTLPGGKRETFTFSPKRDRLSRFVTSPSGEGGLFRPQFKAQDGSQNTLTVKDVLLTRNPNNEYVTLGGRLYNPEDSFFGGSYTLTTKEGIVYNIDALTGDLWTVRDRNGNTLTYTDEGIFSDTGVEVTFSRDAQGRISSVIDPAGEKIVYEYDAVTGNLVGVRDREDNTTTLEYEMEERPHYLTGINDPLGREAVRNEYDESGRLKRILDVNGSAVELEYDPDNSTQTFEDVFGNRTTYVYDERGNILTEVDPVGLVAKRTYDDDNNMLTETIISDASGPEGYTTTYTYDNRGNQLTKTDPLGNTYRYSYNQWGQLLTSTDPLGYTTTYIFDDRGNVSSKTDAEGNTITYTYDDRGNPISIVEGPEDITRFDYDQFGNIIFKVDAKGNQSTYTYGVNGKLQTETKTITNAITGETRTLVTTWDYDDEGNVISIADNENGLTRYEYDANDNRTAIVDALGRRVEMRYDENNQLIETIYPDNTPDDDSDNPRSKVEYDQAGNRIAVIDEEGHVTRLEYNHLNRPTAMILPDNTPAPEDNPRLVVEYNQLGQIMARIDERGNRTEYEYDEAGRMTVVRNYHNGEVLEEKATYDAAGQRISITDGLGLTTQFVYNGLGQGIETIFPDNYSSKIEYDAFGNEIAVTDQAGITTRFEYDALDQLTAVVDALGQRTEYDYDEVGNLVYQKDANNRVTRFSYDGLGRQTGVMRPNGQLYQTVYDQVGNVRSTIDFNGETIEYDYNNLNKLVTKSFLDGSVSFTYTPSGKLETVTDERGTTIFDYDARGNLLSRTEPDDMTISYTYNDIGLVETVTTPTGTTHYAYNSLNLLDTVTRDGEVTDYDYDKEGNLIQTLLPNGVVETRQYDELNRLIYLENADANETVLSSYRYTLDEVGHRQKVEELGGRVVEYDYDELYRLIREEITEPVQGTRAIDYVYDPVGNRLERDDSIEGLTTYIYNDNDWLLSEITPEGTISYSYDDNGNVTDIRRPDGQVVYDWDGENRLIGASITDSQGTRNIEYQYDPNGIRVATIIDSEETRYLIDANREYAEVLEEYNPSTGTPVTYVQGLNLISQNRDGNSSFYLFDGHSGVRLLSDELGAATDTYNYDAYGSLLESTGSTENSYLYRGEQFDANVDLQYLRARYYDPNLGRFVSVDPFEGIPSQPRSRHRYIYGNGNPVTFEDPSGLSAIGGTQELGLVGKIQNILNRINWGRMGRVGRIAIKLAKAFVGNTEILDTLSNKLRPNFLRWYGETQWSAFTSPTLAEHFGIPVALTFRGIRVVGKSDWWQ